MTRHLKAILLAALPLVSAFQNTAPLLVWSSSSSEAIDSLPSNTVQASTVLDALLSDESVCDYDAVVLVSQRGLHASDLRTLSPSSALPSILKSSPSSRSFQYLSPSSPSSPSLSQRAHQLATDCSARLLSYAPIDGPPTWDAEVKHVISLTMEELEGSGAERRSIMSAEEDHLGDQLSILARDFPNHLVIYTGIPTQELRARQASVSPLVEVAAAAKKHRTGILHTYQILTPGLITVLLVVFFILVPVLMLGINALAGIQNMVKLEAPKGYDARERKNQ